MSDSFKEIPGGHPSIITPTALQCDSPNVVTLNKFPNELIMEKMVERIVQSFAARLPRQLMKPQQGGYKNYMITVPCFIECHEGTRFLFDDRQTQMQTFAKLDSTQRC